MSFTCEICVERAILTQRFHHDHICDDICLSNCDLSICMANCAPNICLKCLASHIQAKVDENIGTIKCPSCHKTLNPVECRLFIPAELFVKWCDCRCKLSVLSPGNSYCPSPTCSELILNECNETTKRCACPRCQRLMCYECRVPWHAGFSCRESARGREASDHEFGFLVEQKKWTRCPCCGQATELMDGCPFIKCRCGRRFCHKCGAAISTELSLHVCDHETKTIQFGKCLFVFLLILFHLLGKCSFSIL